MDRQKTKNIVEATLMCAGQPLEPNEILRVFDEENRPERKLLDDLLAEIDSDFAERSLELKKVASGYRLQVRTDYSDWLGRLGGQRVPKYSRALLETLVLVAYRQPVTRGEIESVRGVSVSSNIVRTLLERGWVRIVGHRDVPGRPAMLGTTKEFLDYFCLKSLDELPTLSELKDFDSLNVELDFDGPEAQLEAAVLEALAEQDDAGQQEQLAADIDELAGTPDTDDNHTDATGLTTAGADGDDGSNDMDATEDDDDNLKQPQESQASRSDDSPVDRGQS